MNVSSACPQCGAVANPNDKFCNTCGTPLRAAAPPGAAPPQAYAPPPAQQYGAQPPGPVPQPYPFAAAEAWAHQPQPPQAYPQQQGYPQQPPQQGYPPQGQPPVAPQGQYGAPRMARCQLGHEIMRRQSVAYCAQGKRPIALDAMQFAGDPNAGAYAQPPPQQSPYASSNYASPQPAGGSPFDAPRGVPAPQPPQGFGAPPQQYVPQPQQGYGAPPPAYPQQPPVHSSRSFKPPRCRRRSPQGMYAPPPPVGGIQGAETALDRAIAGGKVLRGFDVSFQSNAGGEFWPLYTGRLTVGRANAPEPADIPLADATISSRHAAFAVDGNAVVVEDTTSTNGTYVNEEHIGQNGRREIRDGDRVRFGGYTTLVKILGRLG